MNCKLHSSVSPVVRLTSAVLAASAKLGTPGRWDYAGQSRWDGGGL